MRTPKPWLKRGAAFIAAAPFVLISTAAIAGDPNPNSTTLPNGANLSVEINSPGDSTEFKVPAASGPGGMINVPIEATGAVGLGVPNLHITFVVDVSGSTGGSCPGFGTILDCEKLSVLNVLSDPNFSSVKDVGVSVFGSSGATADMNGASITSVNADAVTVVNSIVVGGVNQFTPFSVGTGSTNYTAGLNSAAVSVGASAALTKRVFFISDGASNTGGGGFNAAVAALVGAGAQIDSFAVTPSPTGCTDGSAGTLDFMATATGGTCTPVTNPAQLVGLLQNLIATSLDDVQIAVDGGGVTTGCVPGLPTPGPVSSSCDANPSLGVGDYDLEATAIGTGGGSLSVTANSVQIHLLQLTASPDTASNELSNDDEHTVSGQILGGTGPDRNIDFEVVSGPHTGASGSETATPGGDAVSFQYFADGNECSSLGTDTITVSATIGGMLDSIDLTKDWVDTIPPEATCEPTQNPHGNQNPQAPGNGGQGQNQDGFYILEATDNLSGDSCAPLEIFVTDDVSGTVFGPFAVGTEIKYTQDPDATPVQKQIGGRGANSSATDTDWHIIGNGDAVVTAVDGAGNVSAPVSCLVPPPPK